MLLYSAISQVLYALHYILLGAVGGAILDGLSAARDSSFYLLDGRKITIALIFTALQTTVVVMAWTGPVDLLALAGTLLATVALLQSSPQRIRWISITSAVMWAPYNLSFGAYVALAINVGIVGSCVIGIIRFRLNDNKQPRYLNSSRNGRLV